ncbi:nitroreductase family protein [Microbacterium gorillae]|uniref:nitroreductase family protein n=1 Tax=Microbacterium gorillae TaxID=1231063 RepID=UPI000AE71204
MTAFDAVLARRSQSKVTDSAPDHDELARLVAAAGRVADHSSLRPWRLIELRGDARLRLGRALAHARGEDAVSTKPLRAPLLIAVVVVERPSSKVPGWEQEAVAAGVAHTLSLLLDEAGWGVIWRTGEHTRAERVALAHGLRSGERLLGWLYVGGKPDDRVRGRRELDAEAFLSDMPTGELPTALPAAPSKKKNKDKSDKHGKKGRKKAKKKAEKERKKSRSATEGATPTPVGEDGANAPADAVKRRADAAAARIARASRRQEKHVRAMGSEDEREVSVVSRAAPAPPVIRR